MWKQNSRRETATTTVEKQPAATGDEGNATPTRRLRTPRNRQLRPAIGPISGFDRLNPR